MKFFVVVLALVASVAADPIETMKPYNVIHEECAKESQITPEQTQMIMELEYPDEDEVHEYVLCSAQNMGVFDDEGIDLDQISAIFNLAENETIKNILDNCLNNNEDGISMKVWAYRGLQCVLKSDIGEGLKKTMQANRESRAQSAVTN